MTLGRNPKRENFRCASYGSSPPKQAPQEALQWLPRQVPGVGWSGGEIFIPKRTASPPRETVRLQGDGEGIASRRRRINGGLDNRVFFLASIPPLGGRGFPPKWAHPSGHATIW